MAIIAKATGSSIEPVKEGIHHAVCVGVFDSGTHFFEAFGTSTHKVILTWEIPEERITVKKDGESLDRPRVISKTYTLTLHEKSTLYKDLCGWRNKTFTEKELQAFHLETLLGKNCMLQVLHHVSGGKTFAKVEAVLPLYKGMKPVAPEGEVLSYSFDVNGEDIPEGVPKWIADMIQKSEEYARLGEEDVPDVAVKDDPAPWEVADGSPAQAEEEVPF